MPRLARIGLLAFCLVAAIASGVARPATATSPDDPEAPGLHAQRSDPTTPEPATCALMALGTMLICRRDG